MLPTLDEFLKMTWNNAYIAYPGFDSLYVRKGRLLIDLEIQENVFTIANIVATHPRNGAFKNLLKDLLARGFIVYIECVHTSYFQVALERMGAKRVNQESGAFHYCFRN